MSITETNTGRRSLLLGLAALGLMLPAGVTRAEPPIDPWAGRELRSWERIRLATFAERMNKSFGDLPVSAEIMADHVRIRIPAALSYVSGRDALKPEGVALLTLVAEELTDQKLLRVEIVAHHDARPEAYEAYTFTQRRATAAMAALISRGIDPARLKATGLGLKFPFTDPSSPENQRIELIVRPL